MISAHTKKRREEEGYIINKMILPDDSIYYSYMSTQVSSVVEPKPVGEETQPLAPATTNRRRWSIRQQEQPQSLPSFDANAQCNEEHIQ